VDHVHGGGRLRLVADAVGREGRVRPQPAARFGEPGALAGSGTVAVRGGVVTFVRPGLTEEYATSVDGVRQDFVVDRAPEGAGRLQVDLALTGARADALVSGARLTLDGSGRALGYRRLRVVDAADRELAASFDVLASDRLAVRVDDAAAVYPVRIDPTFSDSDWVSLNSGIPGASAAVDAVVVDGSGNLYINDSPHLVRIKSALEAT
jgi:hypothetical protein